MNGSSSASLSRPVSPSPSEVASHSQIEMPSIQHTALLTSYLQSSFLPSILPTIQEFAEKEAVRQRLEQLAQRLLPGTRLLPFGSTANGFSLRNSDMDLCCCFPPNMKDKQSPAILVEMLGALIEQETDYYVKTLPRARIPIIKLTIVSSQASPFGMSCDIGFENRLALENTRLLYTYALVDSRLRTMVLFVKVWTKRRKINNPYVGTLSSYGYVLLVIFYLVHVLKDPVLPNLQRMPPVTNLQLERSEIDGNDITFFDDVELLPHLWQTKNTDNVGQLLIGFFLYFAREFAYQTDVISIRSESGVLSKSFKGWHNDREAEVEKFGGPRDLNRFCIEDPFQTNYNVARTVTKDGLFTIRHEIQRASKLLCGRAERMSTLIAELCEEREDIIIPCPPGASSSGGRRQSAPSPRMRPTDASALRPLDHFRATDSQTMQDFRAWVATHATTVPNTHSVSSSANSRNASSTMSSPTLSSATQLPLNGYETNTEFGTASYQSPSQHVPKRYQQFAHRYNTHHTQRYTQNTGYRRNQHLSSRYNSNYTPYHYQAGLNQSLSSSNAPQSLGHQLERRSSWDGSVANPQQENSVEGNILQSSSSYQEPSFELRGSAVTAPASPIVGSPNFNTQRPHQNMLGALSNRSQSHDRSIYNFSSSISEDGGTLSAPSRPLSSISFGDFSADGQVDATTPQVEERKRRGFNSFDHEQELISFGEVRVFRRAPSAENGHSIPSYISKVGPKKPVILPSVVEAVETIPRPDTPVSASSFSLPSAGKGPPSSVLPRPKSNFQTPTKPSTSDALAQTSPTLQLEGLHIS